MKLIITEKPKVSKKIAEALSKSYKRVKSKVYYYKVELNGESIVIASAAGHLYTLAQVSKGWSYPVFDVEWREIYKVEKGKAYTKKYIDTISKLSKNAKEVIIATDYDIEGELLGYNIYRFLSNGRRPLKRMKFSTLTKGELFRSFFEPIEVDLKLVDAGETRHILDWYWGINTSRALTLAVKKASKRYAIISAGRVQTPALAILVEREKKIESFVPKIYWEIYAELEKGIKFIARHEKGKISDKNEVKRILENSRSKFAIITKVEKSITRKLPPVPFDLGSLQIEAYRIFGFIPKKTQDLAQALYEAGYISYPRTSSQKLPPSIGYERIIRSLAKAEKFRKYAEMLLTKKTLKPRQGAKEDPAHPAIFPTGVIPKSLTKDEEKLYSLIVHRFLAVFGSPAKAERTSGECLIGQEKYLFSGIKTIDKGWLSLYPYAKIEEKLLPELKPKDEVKVLNVKAEEKKTSPPARFNPASLVKELEKRELGTKATRAEIVDTLYKRGYIEGNPIRVTKLGFAVIEALKKYVPEIISEELTREFERKIESIRKGEETKENVLKEAKLHLQKIMEDFKKKEEEIGLTLGEIIKSSSIVGKCPNCGGELRIIKSKKTKKIFIGCSNYPKCSTSFPLPQKKGIKVTDKICEHCGMPMVSIPFKRRRILSCINPECKSKKSK